jgi:hypothetical protein
MTDFTSTLTLTGAGALFAQNTFEDTINSPALPPPQVAPSFDFVPKGAVFTYVAGQNSYVPVDGAGNFYYYVSTGNAVTFTASVAIPSGDISILEYYWDFGDGGTGYGSPVAHTYKAGNLNIQCVLRVTDNYGRRFYFRKQMYVQAFNNVVPAKAVVLLAF